MAYSTDLSLVSSDYYTDPGQPGSSTTILVVEDNSILRQGIQLLLETDGFHVLSAADGVEALQQMELTTPDLILSDISMPRMDGYSLFDAVRAHPAWITIPFVFLTAHATRQEVFEGKRLGAEDYLVKPVNHQELVTTIRARLARNKQLMLAQLQQAYQMSLIMLANAIELRDEYTRGHVERVMDYAVTIAKRMGVSTTQIHILQIGSILHDVGKIYIDRSLLRKAGRLSAEEWQEMKRHPVIGAELVKNIPYLSEAIPIIRHHHERWDGSGYPDGLVGQQIPLMARIVAVADSLDAMTSHRAYQEACQLQQAYEEILHNSGRHYDPRVVSAFQDVWPVISPRTRCHPLSG